MQSKAALIVPDLALSVCEPWAWAIAAGWKSIENRSWAIPATITPRLPLRIAIHASLSTRFLEDEEIDYWLQDLHPGIDAALSQGDDRLFNPGCLVGVVDLLGCVPYSENLDNLARSISAFFDGTFADGADYSPSTSAQWHYPHGSRQHAGRAAPLDPLAWAAAGSSLRNFCWLLANPIRFRQPIPAKGKLNFWKLEQVHQTAIRRQLKQNGSQGGSQKKAAQSVG